MHTFISTIQDDGRYLFSVGCWAPAAYQDKTATWTPLRDCASSAEAALWVNYLNGGTWIANHGERACIVEDWMNLVVEGPE